MPRQKSVPVALTAEERQVLERITRSRIASQGLALRSKIVLACADGAPNSAIARDLRVSRTTVIKWRSRFLAAGMAGLSDAPRPGAPRKITDKQIEVVIAKTLEEPRSGCNGRWTTRSLAAATGISQSTVSRIWRSFGISPDSAATAFLLGERLCPRINESTTLRSKT
jgi:transposase